MLAAVIGLAWGWWLVLASIQSPGRPWLAYHWFAWLMLVGCAAWTTRARQRKDLFGDRALRFWIWHYFTGAPLVVVDNPQLPWWEDVRRCWPFLDTDRSEPCPEHRRWSCYFQRAIVAVGRTVLVSALVLVEYLRSGAPHGLGPRALATWGLGGLAAAIVFVYGATRGAIGWARYRWWYRPLHLALGARAGWMPGKRPHSWLKIPRTFGEIEVQSDEPGAAQPKAIRIRFALDYLLSSDNKTKTLDLVCGILGLRPEAVDVTWDPVGEHEDLWIRPARLVPARVLLANRAVRRAIERVKGRWDYVVGFGEGWKVVKQSIEDQAPHIMIAGPTKTGKSQLLKVILWQLLTKWARYTRKHPDAGAAQLYFLDIKGYSHDEFEDRPGVTYATTPAAMKQVLFEIRRLGIDRGAQLRAARRRGGRDPVFAPVFVVFEDMGAAWPKIKSDPQVVEAWDDILSLMRGVSIHGIALPHSPHMKYLGNGSVRDNLGNRILMSGHGKRARTMVADDCEYDIPAEKKGRFVVLEGLVGHVTQGILDADNLIGQELDLLLGPKFLDDATDGDDQDQASEGDGPERDPDEASHTEGDDASKKERVLAGQLQEPLHGRLPGGDVVGVDSTGARDGLVIEDQPGSDVRLPPMVEGELTGPSRLGVPGRTQTVADVDSHLVTAKSLDQTGDKGGCGAHDPILTQVRKDGQGESAGDARNDGGERGQEISPAGATPWAPQAPISVAAASPAAGARGAPTPEGSGVMDPEPSRTQPTPNIFAPQTHPQSPSRLGDPGEHVSYRQVEWGSGDPEGGPDPVTLREGWARAQDPSLGPWGIGAGLEYESVRTAMKRARRKVEAGVAGAWLPERTGTRVLAGGQKVAEFHAPRLHQWWKSLTRAAPDDGIWWVYFMVQGGLPALRYGVIVKIGWTNDLERRCTDFGNHYPGFDGVGGDLLYLERFPSEAEARAAEKRYHRRWKVERTDGRGSAPEGVSLQRYPQGGGGKGGREQFWCEGSLATFMAEHCPTRRAEAS